MFTRPTSADGSHTRTDSDRKDIQDGRLRVSEDGWSATRHNSPASRRSSRPTRTITTPADGAHLGSRSTGPTTSSTAPTSAHRPWTGSRTSSRRSPGSQPPTTETASEACSLPATKSTGRQSGRSAKASSSSRPPTPDTSTSMNSLTHSEGSNTRLHHYTPAAGRSTWPTPPSTATSPKAACTSPRAARNPLVPIWSRRPRPCGTCGSSGDHMKEASDLRFPANQRLLSYRRDGGI